MERPDFIKEKSSFADIARLILRLDEQIIQEEAVARRIVLLGLREPFEARLGAFRAMKEEAVRYARHVRSEEFRPTLGGVPKDAKVKTPGGEIGTVTAFRPTFEPTHLVVGMANGTARYLLPEDVLIVGED